MKHILILSISLLFIACGKDKTTEVCDCIETNVSTKSTPEEASAALQDCTKSVSSTSKEMTGAEKAEFNNKVNDCLKDSETKNGVKMEFNIQ